MGASTVAEARGTGRVLLAAWVWRENRAAAPLTDLSLLQALSTRTFGDQTGPLRQIQP